MEFNPSILAYFTKVFKGRLQRFGLLGYYEPDDVINESVKRLYRKIKAGNQILNEKAWIYTTGENYIWELSRNRKKCQPVDPFTFEFMPIESEQHDLFSEETNAFEYSKVREALLLLKPQDREILELRYFENLSWQEIAQYLANQGKKVSLGALRQRGSRAIKHLGVVFLRKYS